MLRIRKLSQPKLQSQSELLNPDTQSKTGQDSLQTYSQSKIKKLEEMLDRDFAEVKRKEHESQNKLRSKSISKFSQTESRV